MIFNFAQKRKSKKRGGKVVGKHPVTAGTHAHAVPSTEYRVPSDTTSDTAGGTVAFGPVYEALSDMEVGGRGILGEFDMPEQVAEQLMNLGLVPGLEVMVAQSGPGGDPRVYRVDGVEVALRGELAKLIAVAPMAQTAAERTLSLRDKSAAPAAVKERTKRPTLRYAKDGAPIDGLAASGTPGRRPGATQALSTQEASAD